MKYNELDISKNKAPTRVGRGISAGKGKTAGRGTKGQKARTGKKLRPGFEGGQNPLMQRLPKLRGFTSHRPKAEVVYTGQLETLGAASVDTQALADAGLVTSAFVRVKLILRGDLTRKVDVKLQAASESAIAAIQKAGGSFEKVELLARPASAKKAEKKAAREAAKK